MILYYTPNSPYARTARIAVREWGLLNDIDERLAQNRQPNNPVLAYSPVGRVPTLIDKHITIVEAQHIFQYIKHTAHLSNKAQQESIDWNTVAQSGQITGFLDGIAFWIREQRRPVSEQSTFLLEVEKDRAFRCLDYFESNFSNMTLPDVSEFRAAALASALDLIDLHRLIADWNTKHPKLFKWLTYQLKRTSMQATAPKLVN